MTKKQIIGSSLIILICLVIVSIIKLKSDNDEYLELLNSNEQLVLDEKYELAVEGYLQITENDSRKVEPYLKLAQIYEISKDYDSASSILELGYKNTKQLSLLDYLSDLEEKKREYINDKKNTKYNKQGEQGVEVGKYFNNIAGLEYQIFAMARGGLPNYRIEDIDNDGICELMLEEYLLWQGYFQMVLDMSPTGRIFNIYDYSSGMASTNFTTLLGEEQIYFCKAYISEPFESYEYYLWDGEDWCEEAEKELDGIKEGYENPLYMPPLQYVYEKFEGPSNEILDEFNNYIDMRDDAYYLGEIDIDADSSNEHIYYVTNCLADWYDQMKIIEGVEQIGRAHV